MTNAELKRIGRKVFGKEWVVPMSVALGANRVTVWRWKMKRTRIPDSQVTLILELEAAHDRQKAGRK